MNPLSEIVSAIAEDAPKLPEDQEIHIPLDENLWISVMRPTASGRLVVTAVRQPLSRTEAEQASAHEALLRLTADSRWTDGFTGGLDAEGHECLSAEVAVPVDAQALERCLERLLTRGASGRPGHSSAAVAAVPDLATNLLRV
ncbi:MAG: type III secretion system chaperone [Proteobacteria bacterium]|jgi:hypothetical protein|nr:type III secretion system chaperone [Pseudomonadota bacterium]